MLYLSGFELYSRWVPLKDQCSVFPQVRESKTVFRFLILRRGFRIFGQWNLDSRFQSLVGSGFLELYSPFPKPKVLDSTSKYFPDCENCMTKCYSVFSRSKNTLRQVNKSYFKVNVFMKPSWSCLAYLLEVAYCDLI